MNSPPSLHRRDFLRTGALATVAGVAISREALSQDPGGKPIQVGMITHQTIPYDEMAIALASIPGARVCAVTNLSPWVTRRLGMLFAHFENPNISVYSDYREMLDQEPNLDAVIILTPQWLRVR
jgi:hypothetical protein